MSDPSTEQFTIYFFAEEDPDRTLEWPDRPLLPHHSNLSGENLKGIPRCSSHLSNPSGVLSDHLSGHGGT